MSRAAVDESPRPADRDRLPRLPSRYLPGLDTLRSLAVVAVIFFHLGLPFGPGGFLGVSLFFTVSGFLITRNFLLEVRTTNTVSLRNFWGRRARRLLPAAWVVLAIIAIAVIASDAAARGLGFSGGDLLSALGSVANWRFLSTGSSYASLFKTPSVVRHYWSLAIEEQAYVIVALLVAVVVRRRPRRPAAVLLRVSVFLAIVSWMLPIVFGMSVARVYYGTDTRIGEILIGVALACWNYRTAIAVRTRRAQRWWTLIAISGFALLAHTTTTESAGLTKGLLPLMSLVSCALILVAVSPTSRLARLGATRVVGGLGRVSYVVYLVHWPIILIMRWQNVRVRSIGAIAVLAVSVGVLGWAMTRFIERPIRTRRWPRGRVVLAAAVAVALVVSASTFLRPSPSAADRTLTELEQQVDTFGRLTNDEGSDATGTTEARPGPSTSHPPTTEKAPSPSTAKTTPTKTTETKTTETKTTETKTTVKATGSDATTDTTKTTTTKTTTTKTTTTETSAQASSETESSPTTTPATDASTQPSGADASTPSSGTLDRPADSPIVVRAFGDSIMLSLALVSSAASGEITYAEGTNDLRIGCGVTAFPGDRHANDCPDALPQWVEDSATVSADVAVVFSCQWELVARTLPGGDISYPGKADFDAYVLDSYRRVIDQLLQSGIPQVLWVRCPQPSQTVGTSNLSDVLRASRQPERIRTLNAIIESAAAEFPGRACTVPFDAWMAAHTNDADMRPDGEHFAKDQATAAGEEFIHEIVAAYNTCGTG
jgi:peptidoglycan/LPS O-acetylase OafA/YrhL